MVDFRLVIGDPSSKKSFQKKLEPAEARKLYNKKVGDVFPGDLVGLPGYEFKIRGGTDASGFPMRMDLIGMGRKAILVAGGVGMRPRKDGERRKKTVHTNVVDQTIAQLNVVVIKGGSGPLQEMLSGDGAEKKDSS